jgi:hypothetical protein
MDKTLPPGWTGNSARHHAEITGLTVEIRRGGNRYLWDIHHNNRTLLMSKNAPDTAAQARADALTAIEAFAHKLLEQAAQLRAGEL